MINRIISHYRIIKELGRGGMGEVYLAQDLNLPRRVAIKFLSIPHASKPEFIARFKQEAEAAVRINHPNIVTIYETGEFENRPYIVMEYVEGGSLADLIKSKELKIEEVLDIVILICEGLSKAHQIGIIHRDLKPSNLLMNADRRVKIVDFGLAKLKDVSSITIAPTKMGTVPYMSPEQDRGEKVNQQSDIFSLGVVLYELITRQLPFKGDSYEAISYARQSVKPEPLARYKSGISDDLQRIVDKALDKELETRYPNVDSLLVDLKREKKVVQAPAPPPAPPPPIKPKKDLTEIKYLDFDLLLEPSGKRYQVRVVNAPGGTAAADFSLPFSEAQLGDFLSRAGRPQRGTRKAEGSPKDLAKVFGARLFEAVFHHKLLGCLDKSFDEAAKQGAGVRLRLHLAKAPQLINIPWEYLYNPSLKRFFSIEMPVVRYVDPGKAAPPSQIRPPLQILLMIAGPSDYPEFDVDWELENFCEAVNDLVERGLVALEYLKEATLTALQRRLSEKEFQVFHFIGHSGVVSSTQESALIFENESKSGAAVSGQELGALLLSHPSARFACLNACKGAGSSGTDRFFAGAAQALVQQGLPAAVAMQFESTSQAANAYARELYANLAEGHPVDLALVKARLAIFSQGNNAEWGTAALCTNLADGRIFVAAESPAPQPVVSRKHIFISYRHNDPDQAVALQIYQEFGKEHDVFIDQNIPVGTRWAERIEAELRQSDFHILLLSADSINSELLKAEIETAYRLNEQSGRPIILPVRLAYRAPFPYPLKAYLDPIHWAFWENERDTPRLIQELRNAIAGGSLPINDAVAKENIVETVTASQKIPNPFPEAQRSVRLEMPEGTMDVESSFYVQRAGDSIALAAIERQGVTITIKAPRQMGKSSLLIRVMQAAQKAGKRVVFLDFQLFDKSTLTNADVFFRQFCAFLTDELGMEDRLEEYWKSPLGSAQHTTRYVERHLLKELGGPLVLVMDEVESILDTNFRSDFFAMLRNWHNTRAIKPIWKKLDLVLVTSTDPYLLVENLNQSPFNVGEIIDLPDFTAAEVADLNRRHGALLSAEELKQLMGLVAGHPYLTRRALYLVASQRTTTAELFAKATHDRGPFGDHLRYHLFRLIGKEDLIQGFRHVLRNNRCPDERVFFRLRGAGLVRREGSAQLPRCKLYADYFREHLNG